uniref:RNA polymerase sigma-54 factor n=1 Tax=Candidatus Kentrum sp. DK TaxID=2126562 RepID=A0A450SWG0_9GAMM|nr:MAG: RNA polymerase, sigma 54 subunit, RpoN/SigL [Candidatus Kentron sp. DK]
MRIPRLFPPRARRGENPSCPGGHARPMKQSQEMRVGQQLAITPQLRQSIRLLQLSTLELQMEVQQALESNLMLDTEEEESEDLPGDTDKDQNGVEPDVQPVDIPAELPVDSTWEDVYGDGLQGPASSGKFEGNFQDVGVRESERESLRDHLYRQMELARFAPIDEIIAITLIDAIHDDGYLRTGTEEIRQGVLSLFGNASGEESGHVPEIGEDEIEAVLRRIRSFEPAGVGARDLRECLLLQLNALSPDTPWREEAMALARSHLELLARGNHARLRLVLGLGEQPLQQVTALIRSLDPRPGLRFDPAPTPYVIPDVLVSKTATGWQVTLNPEALPRVRINPYYASLVRRADGSAGNTMLKTHLQEARWFLKGLRDRGNTLLRVATCIVERQWAFFEHGEEALEPMVTQDIADVLGMHASTISRVTSRKYMHTPRGIIELKYLFSSHVNTQAGSKKSSTAVRALIKKLIASEDATDPVSDARLVRLLAERGIEVARRTVAKYRESLKIPSSLERKRML